MAPQYKPACCLVLLMLVTSIWPEIWSGASATAVNQEDDIPATKMNQPLDDTMTSQKPGSSDIPQTDYSASSANQNQGSSGVRNNPETDNSASSANQNRGSSGVRDNPETDNSASSANQNRGSSGVRNNPETDNSASSANQKPSASDAISKHECPSKCACHESTLTSFIVTCSGMNLSDVPSDLPDITTELYLDNNTVAALHQLPVLPALVELSLKHNQITTVSDFQESLPSLLDLDMSNNELHTFPYLLPQSLLRLRLTSNHISDLSIELIQPGSFSKLIELYLDWNELTLINFRILSGLSQCALRYLQKLSLSSNRLTVLEDRTFMCLSSLTAMTISKNHLTDLHRNTFKGLTELTYLDLSSNRITAVEKGTFKKLINLKYLYLNRNQLIKLPYDLPLLDWLDISYNNIEHVNETMSKEDLYPVEIVNLAHNPLVCDCHMLWLKEVWDRREYILKYTDAIVPEDFVPTCAAPIQTADEPWDMLSDDLFRCDQSDNAQEGMDARARTRQQDAKKVTHNDLDVRLTISLGAISFDSITVHWSNSGADSCTWVFVHYYIFGQRAATSMFAQVEFGASTYVVKHLLPASNYVICIVPKVSDELAPTTIDQCVEASTLAMVTVSRSQSWLQDIVYPMMAVVDLKFWGLCFVITFIIVSVVLGLMECFNFFLEKYRKPHED